MNPVRRAAAFHNTARQQAASILRMVMTFSSTRGRAVVSCAGNVLRAASSSPGRRKFRLAGRAELRLVGLLTRASIAETEGMSRKQNLKALSPRRPRAARLCLAHWV